MFEPDFVTSKTDGIVISACQAFNEEDHLCSYYLRIENDSADKIQILGKDLNLTDSFGNNYLQSGVGFKGEIPELNPGEYFEFEEEMPALQGSAVLYGTCRIIKEGFHQIKNIQIPALELWNDKSVPLILN